MSPTQIFAVFAIGGLLLLASNLRKLRRQLQEIAANDSDARAKTAQQQWLLVRNLRLTFPINASTSAIGLSVVLQQSLLLGKQALLVLFIATIGSIVTTSYVWSFRGPPAVLRRWLFDFPTP